VRDKTDADDTQHHRKRRRRDGKDFYFLSPLPPGLSVYCSRDVMEMLYSYDYQDGGSASLLQHMVDNGMVPLSRSAISKRYVQFRNIVPVHTQPAQLGRYRVHVKEWKEFGRTKPAHASQAQETSVTCPRIYRTRVLGLAIYKDSDKKQPKLYHGDKVHTVGSLLREGVKFLHIHTQRFAIECRSIECKKKRGKKKKGGGN
jgi:hypothetical protein